MKTLCVAVVVLSLSSVCQPAPLACETLLKQADNAPDITGRWYAIAMSTNICLVTTIVNSVFEPSVSVTVTKETQNIYNATFELKSFGYCGNESDRFLFENNTMTHFDSNNVPVGKPDVLLQSGCPDCLVVLENDDELFNTFLLYSRRKTVTAAELKEFETQVECAGWSKPQVLSTDHDYESCRSIDSIDDDPTLLPLMYQRLQTTYTAPLTCLQEAFKQGVQTVQQQLDSFWKTIS